MFTGIIKDMGTVERVDGQRGDRRIYIKTTLPLDDVEIGASIACSGCCLTAVEKGADWFAADVSAETVLKTAIGQWQEGTRVNLERSLRAGDEMGGHIVSGHVDGLATIEKIEVEGDSHRVSIRVPIDLAKYIAPKGSVSIDGISLTVNEVEGDVFGINIIPHTWIHTTLGQRQPGDQIHIEIDMLARYVARLLETKAA